MRIETVFLSDLGGTLRDRVHQHVPAWKEAPVAGATDLPVWRLDRRRGTNGGPFINQPPRETKVETTPEQWDGSGIDELDRAGAARTLEDPAARLTHFHEGVARR